MAIEECSQYLRFRTTRCIIFDISIDDFALIVTFFRRSTTQMINASRELVQIGTNVAFDRVYFFNRLIDSYQLHFVHL